LRRMLESAEAALIARMRRRVSLAHGRLDPLSAQVTELSPLKILDRGYAIVTNERNQIVKDPAQAPPGTSIGIRLAQGRLDAEVK